MSWLGRIINGWLCEDLVAIRKELAVARADADDAWESYAYQAQHTAQAKGDLERLQRALTPEGADELAATVTARIADIYASSHRGVAGRDAAVKSVVLAALEQATMGKRA